MNRITAIAGVAVALLASGCATTPESYPAVAEAENRIAIVASTPGVSQNAAAELDKARAQLDKAQRLQADRGEPAAIRHHAYMAEQYANLAAEKNELARARAAIDAADERRQQILLTARERETQRAEAQAAAATVAASLATAEAEDARRDAERARRDALEAERKAREMAEQLAELEATHTERGIVLTLDDVLFEFNKAVLQPGSERTLRKVAEFLREHPGRDVRIEGFTDSIGTDSYNQQLSERRADAVRAALVDAGVAPERIVSAGYGEQYPVATNDTEAGRQQNRRVEIIIADEGKTVGERMASRRR